MAFNTTCPLCELEQRQMEPYTAASDGSTISCIGCDRRSTAIPHELRSVIFSPSFPQESRNRVAQLMSTGMSCADAVKQVRGS